MKAKKIIGIIILSIIALSPYIAIGLKDGFKIASIVYLGILVLMGIFRLGMYLTFENRKD